jgi:hypothetical protein
MSTTANIRADAGATGARREDVVARRHATLAVATAGLLALGACSPEATRTRGGGPGADTGNRPAVVRMHEGSKPYHHTPRLVSAAAPLDGASHARDGSGR